MNRECVTLYLKNLRHGGLEREDAYHALMEADHEIIPDLLTDFQTEANPEIRTLLIQIIWQHRLPETARFLASVLDDPSPTVWKSALDGLVTLQSAEVLALLKAAKDQSDDKERKKWIQEAISQVKGRS